MCTPEYEVPQILRYRCVTAEPNEKTSGSLLLQPIEGQLRWRSRLTLSTPVALVAAAAGLRGKRCTAPVGDARAPRRFRRLDEDPTVNEIGEHARCAYRVEVEEDANHPGVDRSGLVDELDDLAVELVSGPTTVGNGGAKRR